LTGQWTARGEQGGLKDLRRFLGKTLSTLVRAIANL
jgi:hypothetical protein